MNSIRVIEPGMCTTVQDLGREGFGAIGVPAGGAADRLSLVVGNRLVGNADADAGLEMTLVGGVFEFRDSRVIALTGAGCDASLDSAAGPREVPGWCAVTARAGDVLRVGALAGGARSYLCVSGEIDVPLTLGSRCTHLAAGFGGLEGRALRAGDVIGLGPRRGEIGSLRPGMLHSLRHAIARRVLRVTRGPQAEGVFAPLLAGVFRVSPSSDRAGVRLDTPVATGSDGSMVSEGMPRGGVQVPPDGRPIILGVEGPVTGGYPLAACVASVDLPAVGQLRPGDIVRFVEVSVGEARRDLMERARLLDSELAPR